MCRRWKKGGKEEILTVLWGENIIFEKGGGAKISIILIIYTPALLENSIPVFACRFRPEGGRRGEEDQPRGRVRARQDAEGHPHVSRNTG